MLDRINKCNGIQVKGSEFCELVLLEVRTQILGSLPWWLRMCFHCKKWWWFKGKIHTKMKIHHLLPPWWWTVSLVEHFWSCTVKQSCSILLNNWSSWRLDLKQPKETSHVSMHPLQRGCMLSSHFRSAWTVYPLMQCQKVILVFRSNHMSWTGGRVPKTTGEQI